MLKLALFLAASVAGAAASLWVYTADSVLLMLITSVAILLPVIGLAWWLSSRIGLIPKPLAAPQLARLSVAAPFPYTALTWLYGQRNDWLPSSWLEYLNNPTAFLVFITGALAVSLVWTNFVLSRAVRNPGDSPATFRSVAILLFVLMGVAASVGDPIWTIDLFRYFLEPAGIVLFGTAFGRRLGKAPVARAGSLQL